jgi:hypothetical protein
MGSGISSQLRADANAARNDLKKTPASVSGTVKTIVVNADSTKSRQRRDSFGDDDDDDDDYENQEIDANVLFSALLKLSFIFELKESLTKRLIATIIVPEYRDFTEQYMAVEKWVNNYADTNMECEEICHLISYVELYKDNIFEEHLQKLNPGTASVTPCLSALSVVDDIDRCCRLICPYRCELVSWTAEIRHQELLSILRPSYFPGTDMRIATYSTTRIEDILENDQHEYGDVICA